MGQDNQGDDQVEKTSVIQSETFKVRLAQAGQAPPALVLLVGPAQHVGRQWSLEGTDRIIGRSETSHVHIYDPSVSKSHAKIVIQGGEVSIIDLESTNKTIVNGKVIPSLTPVKLSNNDQIKTGNIILKFLARGNIETVSTAETFDRSQTDPLTGIFNRGALNAKANDFFKKSQVLDIPFTLLCFDIDHFKKVNDTYGHSAGDYVLKEIARLIREKLIRENDFFARFGGEEFCVLLLGSPMTQAAEVAERIRSTVQHHSFEFQGRRIPITISLGLASANSMDQAWEPVFERADKALYESKRSGRNRLTLG
jgi:two-component system, cell cycle response regulator